MKIPPMPGRAAALLAASVFIGAMPLYAQMVPGTVAVGQARELGLDLDHRSRDFSVSEIDCSAPANVLWPGEGLKIRFRVTNRTTAPLAAAGAFKIIRYGTRGQPGEIWVPLFYQIAEAGSVPFEVGLAPGASAEVAIEPSIPEAFGGYAILAELPGHGRAFGASVVRSMTPDAGRVQFPAFALDLDDHIEATATIFQRLGIKGARLGASAFASDDPKYAQKWAAFAQRCKTLAEHEITALLMVGASDLPMPLGMARPHLDGDDTFLQTKSDAVWLPSADAEFERWTRSVCAAFGWPGGPLNAIELWNEPWEGISISGWGADMLRFREIFTAMAHGVEAARAENKVNVLIGGCDSSSNTLDKLFPDGSQAFLKWLDFCSIHYQTMAATPALMRNFQDRPQGPVRTWDTESWIGNTDDRTGLVVASMHAMGQERAMGIFRGNVFESNVVKLDDGSSKVVTQAWSASAAVGAGTKFIGQRPFRELLFKNGLPWVFVFAGRPGQSEDDGTVVVTGDLGGCYSRDLLLYRTVGGLKNQERVRALRQQIAALPDDASAAQRKELQTRLDAAAVLEGGSLTISNGHGEFTLADFYGNPVPSRDGRIVVPLDGSGYYLRTDGVAGSFGRLLDAIRAGRIEGYEPVEIIAHDLTAPLSEKPSLRLSVTNILNRPVTGRLSVLFGESKLAGEPGGIRLVAHESREVFLPIVHQLAQAGNTYAMRAEFDAGADGKCTREELLHVNFIPRRTITVDGKLDDWAGVPPQPMGSQGIGASLTEKAYLPFSKFDDSAATGSTVVYAAYDADNFYFAARIADTTPDPGMLRFETRDDDQFFYPETSYRLDKNKTFTKEDKVFAGAVPTNSLLHKPQSAEKIRIDWESVASTMAMTVDLPDTQMHQFSFYFLSWDSMERHDLDVTIKDAATGKTLQRQKVKGFGEGRYLIYNLAGKLRVEISSNNGWKALLGGCFLDAAKAGGTADGPVAQFVGTDDKTRGDWSAAYGAEGYLLAGEEGKLPSFAKVEFSTERARQALQWPQGVRRFSYRVRPDLPAGGPASHDNVQIAFNVLPDDQKPWLPNPPGTPPHWMSHWDSDYEYAFNPVADAYGGGTEIWRLQVPGMPRKHFFPRQPTSRFDGPVKNGQLVLRRDGNTRIVEAALPWTEIPDVKKRLDAGQTIKLDFRVNDNGGPSLELATGRSVSKLNPATFHNDWQTHWSNEVEFGFGR